MDNIISEGLEHVGSIDDNGYIYDRAGKCYAKIDNSGYICQLGKSNTLGKIDEDGSIRDSSLKVIGRIQADGYVFIRSHRVCQVSSAFIEKITPKAWNAGETSTYSGRRTAAVKKEPTDSSYEELSPFWISVISKTILGVVLGIVAWVNGFGGIGNLIAGPILVFLFIWVAKLAQELF